LAGVPPDPEQLIRAGLNEEDLFPDKCCCQCGEQTQAWIPVMIECEAGFETGGFSWGMLILSVFTMLCLPVGFIFLRWKPNVVHHGKGYRVPLLACPECQKLLSRSKTLRRCLRRVTVYQRLLDKYPDARVYVIKQ
jgi:hypothetical protein